MPSVLDTTNALITLASLKSYLSSDTGDEFLTDTTMDNELELIINAASLYANKYTGVDLLSREHTEYCDGNGKQTLFLDNFPVSSTASTIALYVDQDRVYGVDTKIPAASIILYQDIGEVRIEDHIFTNYPQSIKVVYTAGYLIAAVPADLSYAIKLICAGMFKKKMGKLALISSMTTEGQSVTLIEDSMPKMAKNILDVYRRDQW